MKVFSLFSFLVISLLPTLNPSAGYAEEGGSSSTGSGGDIVVCKPSTQNKLNGHYLLDYVLTYKNSNQNSDIVPVKNAEQSLARILSNLQRLSPSLAESLAHYIAHLNNKLNFEKARRWEEALSLVDLKDEEIKYSALPANCKQIASNAVIRKEIKLPEITFVSEEILTKSKIVYVYNAPFTKKLKDTAPLQLSFLLVHEWLWDHSTNIEANRKINRLMHSKEFETIDNLGLKHMLTEYLGTKEYTNFFSPFYKPVQAYLYDKGNRYSCYNRFGEEGFNKVKNANLMQILTSNSYTEAPEKFAATLVGWNLQCALLKETDFNVLKSDQWATLWNFLNKKALNLEKIIWTKKESITTRWVDNSIVDSDFSNTNLVHNDFDHVNINGSNFSGAFLMNSRWQQVNINNFNFDHVNLKNSSMASIIMQQGTAQKANMRNLYANSFDAFEVNFDGADMRDTIFLPFVFASIFEQGYSMAMFRPIEKERIQRYNWNGFRVSSLRNVNFENSVILEYTMVANNLSGANFTNAVVFFKDSASYVTSSTFLETNTQNTTIGFDGKFTHKPDQKGIKIVYFKPGESANSNAYLKRFCHSKLKAKNLYYGLVDSCPTSWFEGDFK